MLIVPLKAVPSQSLLSVLDGQSIQLDIFEKQSGLFANIWLDNVVVLAGVLCQNLNRIVRDAYLGLLGDFVFLDNQGASDPFYTGLGTRFSLCYIEASDLAAGSISAGTT